MQFYRFLYKNGQLISALKKNDISAQEWNII